MTGGSAHDAEGTQTIGNSDGRRVSRRRTRARNSDAVPEGGYIERTNIPSTPQILMAVAALVLVTVVSFGAVSIVGELCPQNRATYWMIELVFALRLCAARTRMSAAPRSGC
jgi:hypothetical protein